MEKSSDQFYTDLSAYYDEMTRFNERRDHELMMLQKWQQRYGFKTALDAACGTGLHAILLATLGVQTTGVDLSTPMLSAAVEHANKSGVSIKWVQSSMQTLSEHIQERFDLIFCLGNSLPHLLSSEDLQKALQNFYQLLNANGHLVVQILNYQRILENNERIINISRQGQREYIRFYDFQPPLVQFNVLQIDWSNDKPQPRLSSTSLFPYCAGDVQTALLKSHFSEIESYGDMLFSPFNLQESQNLVMVSRRIR